MLHTDMVFLAHLLSLFVLCVRLLVNYFFAISASIALYTKSSFNYIVHSCKLKSYFSSWFFNFGFILLLVFFLSKS